MSENAADPSKKIATSFDGTDVALPFSFSDNDGARE
jgi:hypothetical protein